MEVSKQNYIQFILTLILNTIGLTCLGQDLHFSQYYRTPLVLNPANTGSFEEDIRIMAIARNQWATVPVSYNSVGMSIDMNFPFKVTRDKFGAGLQLMADRAGDARFTTLQASASGAYHLVTSGLNFMILSIGVNGNYYQRSYDPYKLTYDNQFNGDYFDPSIPINEQFDRLKLSFFDFGIGLNWQQTLFDMHILNIGGSAQHILSSQQNFLARSTNSLLQPRYNFYLNGEYKFSKTISAIPLTFYQYQDKKYELVVGAGLGLNLATKGVNRQKLKLGVCFRMEDAFIPWIHYDINKSSFQLSYDMNTSPLRIATNSYGGVEFSFGYLIQYRTQKERMYDFCPYIWF